jgi:hypothetical protein
MSNRKYAAAVLEGGPASQDDKVKATCVIIADLMNQVAKDMLGEIRNTYVPVPTMSAISEVAQKEFEEIAPELAKKYELTISTVQQWEKPGAPHHIIIGYRPKPRWKWQDELMSAHIGTIDASHITADSIGAVTIQAGNITADRIRPDIMTGTLNVDNVDGYIRAIDTQRLDGLRDIRTVRVTERYGMGVINTGGMATVGNINFAPTWHAGNTGAGTGLDVDAVDGIHFHDWADTVTAVGVSPLLFEQNEPFDLQVGNTTYRNVEITGVIENA